MRILAFETSAKAASVALLEEGSLLAEAYQNTGLTHSRTLLQMAQNLLQGCDLTPRDIDAVAVASGPGSFTGVRIGVAAAKGFAWGRALPCYGVSTLEAMALGYGATGGLICPVMDARRNQVYNALFQAKQDRILRLREDRAISLEALAQDLLAVREPVILVGDGAVLCYEALRELNGQLILAPEHRRHQRASGVALAAWQAVQAGATGDPAQLVPQYLRLSQAERERLERQAKEDRKEDTANG